MTQRSTFCARAFVTIFPLLAIVSGCSVGRASTVATPETAVTLGAPTPDAALCNRPIILEPSSDKEESDAERTWLQDHYPGHGGSIQGRWSESHRTLDALSFADADGRVVSVCFDISAWFGY